MIAIGAGVGRRCLTADSVEVVLVGVLRVGVVLVGVEDDAVILNPSAPVIVEVADRGSEA